MLEPVSTKAQGKKPEQLIEKSSCCHRRERSKNRKMKSGQESHQKSGARCNTTRDRVALPQQKVPVPTSTDFPELS